MLSEFLPAGAAPFAGIAPWVIAVVFASHFLGFFIRGAFGFGSNMPIVLLTTWMLGPHHAILLVLLCTIFAQLHLLPQGVKTADWKVMRTLVAGMLAGIFIGTWLFTMLAADWLTLVMGVLVTVVVAMDGFKLLQRLSDRIDLRSPWVASSLATASSTIGAVSGGGAFYLLVVYLKLACSTPAALRGTNITLSGIFIIWRTLLVAYYGLITPQLVVESLLLAPAVFLGTWTGTRFFHASSPARFYVALQTLLVVAALALIGKGVVRIA